MVPYCHNCGSPQFRNSHFRFQASDLCRLFLFRLPVRCLQCHERSFASFPQFFKLRRERRARRKESLAAK